MAEYIPDQLYMDKSVNGFLELLKSFINEKEPVITEPVDWKRVFQHAKANSITGIIGYMIMKYDLAESEEIDYLSRKQCTDTVGMTMRRIAQADRLIDELTKENIDVLVTKGYVVRQCYPEPRLRTFGDIDFLIHDYDREKSHLLMQKSGYTVKSDWEPVYTYKRDTELYEFHTELMDLDFGETRQTIDYFKNAWNYAVSRDNHLYSLKPEYHLIYLMAHLAKHIISSGAGIRMYMDIALFIKCYSQKIDWGFVREQFEYLQLEQYADYIFSAIECWFDIRCPVHGQTGKGILDKMLSETVAGGTFGNETMDLGTLKMKRTVRETGSKSKVAALANMVFPPASSLKRRYTYLEKYPFLLPAAWVHRIITNRNKIGFELKTAEKIVKTDMKKVSDTGRKDEKIGL